MPHKIIIHMKQKQAKKQQSHIMNNFQPKTRKLLVCQAYCVMTRRTLVFDTIRHNTYKIFISFDFLAPKNLNIIPETLRAY